MTEKQLQALAKEERRIYQREWRKKNAEHLREYNRNYRKKNAEKLKQQVNECWKRKAQKRVNEQKQKNAVD